ncbi:MAG: response regulator [Candidatus Krumholzibacteria bacterium]|nr:response regulator [Candidatus Krumholzibacteria bacterium]
MGISSAQLLYLNGALMVTMVLGFHALRRRYSLAFLYSILGMIIAIAWVTPHTMGVRIAGMDFLVGPDILFVGVLMGVFLCYVFDGPTAGRTAIAVVVGGTILFPLSALLFRELFLEINPHAQCPFPDLIWRHYAASITAILIDLLALTVVWGLLNKHRRKIPLAMSVFVSLLSIMWMDSFIYITLGYGGSSDFWPILEGTLVSRSIMAVATTAPLTLYLIWEIRRYGWRFESLPVLAIFKLGNLERELKTIRSDLVKGEVLLRESEDRYKASVEDMPLMICRFSPEGDLVYANKDCAHCFFIDPDDLGGVDFLSFVAESHRQVVDDLLSNLTVDRPTETIDFPVMLGDDPQPWHRWTIRALFGWDRRTIAFQAIGQDITKELSLESQFRHGEKMRAVGQLAGSISHDFNNILTAILGNAELALDALDDPEPQQQFIREGLQQIERSGRRAADLIRQLLMFSRRDVSNPEVIDLNQVLRDMEKMLRRVITENIELKVVWSGEPGHILVDASQLEQVIVNLVVNARDAMPDGGLLDLETRLVDIDEYYARNHPGSQPGPHIMLAVSDNGKGIPPENMERLFEPFFTTKTKDKGTGLGLATVYGIVQRFGGHVRVYSEVGYGTAFKVYWPLTETEESRRDQAEAGLIEGGSETILVCEDEDSVRRLTVIQLREAGYTVIEAENGARALKQTAEIDIPVDLLVTDVIMPFMDGKTLSEELTGSYPNLKTLFVSGYTAHAIARHGVLDKGLDFIEKPFNRNTLLTRVRKILNSGQ